ncbi:hypothetical protein GCM10023199_10990 [Actinomycetospora chibensis]
MVQRHSRNGSPRRRLFEAMTRVGLEHAGRAAVGVCNRVDALRVPADPLVADPPERWRGSGPVVLVGGFAATGPVLAPMAGWLERLGWDVVPVTDGAGLGCAGRAADALTEQLHVAAERSGTPVRVIGHSRGGQFARVAARQALDAGVDVAALVTLGSPFDLYGLRWPLLAQATALSLVGSLGAPGLASLACLRGPSFRAGLRARWTPEVPFTSIYSPHDRAVPASSSIDPHARNVEVATGHVGLLTTPSALTAVADALVTPDASRAVPLSAV